MKRYYYHPDNIVYITNDTKQYFEPLKFAKFDLGSKLKTPIEGADEFEYVVGYGTKYFNRQGLVTFDETPRADLDELIENIDELINKKARRGKITDDVWQIPEDMKNRS